MSEIQCEIKMCAFDLLIEAINETMTTLWMLC